MYLHDQVRSSASTETSISAPPGYFVTARMHHLQSRRFSGDGPYAIARISTPPGPRKGALQSLQRGGEGSAPHIRRMLCRRG